MHIKKFYSFIRHVFIIIVLQTTMVGILAAHDPELFGEKSLIEVLEEFSEKYKVLFSYDSKSLDGIKVNFEFREGENLNSAIQRLLSPLNLEYETFGDK